MIQIVWYVLLGAFPNNCRQGEKMRRLIVCALVLWLAACMGSNGPARPSAADHRVTATGSKTDPVPTATALQRPGDLGDGSIVMVNGRAISPVGTMINVLDYPSKILLLPNRNLAISSMRSPGVTLVDGTSFTQIANVAMTNAFYGLAANAAGDKLWVSGGYDENVYEYDISTGTPALIATLGSRCIPSGVALTPDQTKLLVCDSWGSAVQIYNAATGAVEMTAPANMYPYQVLVSADGTEAYVSNWGDDTVTILDVAAGQRLADVAVGLHPEGLALSPDGKTLYVANSDSDTVSVVDLTLRQTTAEYNIYEAATVDGATPIDLVVSPDGSTLYVAAAGLNAVVVLDAAAGTIKGMIPAGYYPSAVALDPVQNVLYVGNGKGGGIPGGTPSEGVDMSGTLQKIDIPNAGQLASWTQMVNANLTRTSLYWQSLSFQSPIPTQRGQQSQQIKRVIFIMKENKTFDQVFGDMATTDHDPSLLEFGQAYTPNAHALASQFTIGDNYYSEANVSLQGHMWSVDMFSNDYNEKAWATNGREPLPNDEPAARPSKGDIFENLLKNKVSFRVYGQVLALADLGNIAPYVDLKYGFWNQSVSDETKAAEVIRELKSGIWPQLIYISLPNDHTQGTTAGVPTPQYDVGDNDAGLGDLLTYITHTPQWSETAVFVMEDDPQSGADHVDPHRSELLVISPWAKHNYVSSVLYSMSSVWMTVEMILGLPPLAVYDENTSPMYDAFTMTPDNSTFTGVPNPIPLAYNASGAPFSDYCSHQDWSAPDQARNLGEVLWAVMRPGVPWPAKYSIDSYPGSAGEDESLDAVAYVNAVKALEKYALTHGLWDGSRLPTIAEQVARGELKPVR
jgi:YVTN family beta-propeller protein